MELSVIKLQSREFNVVSNISNNYSPIILLKDYPKKDRIFLKVTAHTKGFSIEHYTEKYTIFAESAKVTIILYMERM